jgi:hypothetical protein
VKKRTAFPPCGTCDLAIPHEADKATLYCRGGPPGVFIELVAVQVPGSNQVQQERRISSSFPPVGKDKQGCALHPLMRKKLGRG